MYHEVKAMLKKAPIILDARARATPYPSRNGRGGPLESWSSRPGPSAELTVSPTSGLWKPR